MNFPKWSCIPTPNPELCRVLGLEENLETFYNKERQGYLIKLNSSKQVEEISPDFKHLLQYCQKTGVPGVIVMAKGEKRGLPIFGPTRLAAEIEGSKVFSKEFMKKYDIPTAAGSICSSLDEALDALKDRGVPCVIKVEGIASGKAVIIPRTKKEAQEALEDIFEDRKFGNAGSRVLVEEFLEGEEVSVMAVTDGKRVVPIAPAKDYKKAFDGDEGPNTGGMGSHCRRQSSCQARLPPRS